jgi:D-sedoheptulose 7-phosphate isomerase
MPHQQDDKMYIKLIERKKVINDIINSQRLLNKIETLKNDIKKCKGKIIIFGCGGSATDSQHIVAEFISLGINAISLSSPATITSIANDIRFDYIFLNQLKAILEPNDLVIALSTSGTSPATVNGLKYAEQFGVKAYLITGRLKEKPNRNINIPSMDTQIIQEMYMMIFHEIYRGLKNG